MEQTSSATSDPDSTKDGTPASDEAEVGDLLDAIRQALQQSGSGSDGGVHAMIGSAQDAWYTFSKFAQPGTIRPHPNRAVRDAGGYIAEMLGGAVIGFRPFSKSGPPVIDLHGVRGFDWLRKFKFLH